MKLASKKLGVTCFLAVILLLPLAQFQNVHSLEQSDRPLSFVTEGLQLDVVASGEWAYTTDINGSLMINVASYTFESEEASVDVSCRYSYSGEGLWFVTLETNKASTTLPICAQPSAGVVDRARDFLERYQN
jgi:hypothetical protein